MDVVRHDHPGIDPVPSAIQEEQRVFDHCAHIRPAEVAGAVSPVQVILDAAMEFPGGLFLGQQA